MIEIEHLSYSSVTTYMKCPQQWRLKYIEKVDQEKSDALVFGSAIHRAISLGIKDELQPSLYWSTSLEQIQAEQKFELSAELVNLGETMLTTGMYTFADLLSQQIQGIDKKVKLELPGIVLPVVGYVDLITENAVIDFKTSKRKWSQVQADKSLQPTFYLAALNQIGTVQLPAKFTYIILTKTKVPQVQIIETERTAQDVFRLFDLIASVWDAIKKEVFPPTDPSNWWCSEKYCGVWTHCEFGGKS